MSCAFAGVIKISNAYVSHLNVTLSIAEFMYLWLKNKIPYVISEQQIT
jgi:hypothetical protein